jgi:hypothetical protein
MTFLTKREWVCHVFICHDFHFFLSYGTYTYTQTYDCIGQYRTGVALMA